MSILNVNHIQPVGSGQTVTINAANISAGSATLTAGTFNGNLTGNLTGNIVGVSSVTGLVVSGMTTATGGIQVGATTSITVGSAFIRNNAVGLGTTSTTGRNAGVGTAYGTLIYNVTDGYLQVYSPNNVWESIVSVFSASGGTESTTSRSGYKVHTFTSPGTFTVNGGSKSVEYLVVGGGGGGGSWYHAGGGGAGALRFGTTTLTAGNYSVLIGSGGAGGPVAGFQVGNVGAATTFGSITSPGGGAGNVYPVTTFPSTNPALDGGSGGGGATEGGQPQALRSGGDATGAPGGTTGSTSPPAGWGNPGGYGEHGPVVNGGGGGGASAAGTPGAPGVCGTAGKGGDGLTYSINGTPTTYAGGGGGSNYNGPATCWGPGGSGGGGRGGANNAATQALRAGADGTANTGSGGGGGERPDGYGGSGGSGIVIIAYQTS